MTLGRLVLAWVPVALWFASLAAVTERWRHDRRLGGRVARAAAEALAATLLASLWFDSLGHGGWWLVFLLIGVLAGMPRLRQADQTALPAGSALWLGTLDVARYVVAGGILAWRLA